MNHCGECSMCCKFMAIPMLHKDDGQWCQFCDVPNGGTGCNIYKDRPEVCQGFKCLWLTSQELDGENGQALPAHLRPDRCKVMLGGTTREDCIMVYVDKSRPDAWRDDEILQLIGRLVVNGDMYAIVGTSGSLKRRFFYKFNNMAVHRWVDMGPPDAEGTQYVI
jgi:hypothetical protein